jgi:TatD DNase family protein
MAPTWTDTHCHLEPADLSLATAADVADVDAAVAATIAAASAAGVGRLIAIGSGHGLAEIRNAIGLAHRYPNIVAAIGVHPHDADCLATGDTAASELWQAIVAAAADPKVVAIGETGLDYHYQHAGPAAQASLLRRFIDLAAAVAKPLTLHIRSDEHTGARAAADAHADARQIVAESAAVGAAPGGVVHCFTGGESDAIAWLNLGFYISFSGIVTFKTAQAIRDAARIVPADRLLLETDAPYLAPIPHRGKRNQPAYLVHTAALLAELRGVSVAELASQTTANASRLFRLPS